MENIFVVKHDFFMYIDTFPPECRKYLDAFKMFWTSENTKKLSICEEQITYKQNMLVMYAARHTPPKEKYVVSRNKSFGKFLPFQKCHYSIAYFSRKQRGWATISWVPLGLHVALFFAVCQRRKRSKIHNMAMLCL